MKNNSITKYLCDSEASTKRNVFIEVSVPANNWFLKTNNPEWTGRFLFLGWHQTTFPSNGNFFLPTGKWEGQSLFSIKLIQLISDHPLLTSVVFFRAFTQNEDTHFVFTSNCINHLNCTYSALFSAYSGIMHRTSCPCCTASLKIHLTHNKGIICHKSLADMTMFKHVSLHWYWCMYKQRVNTQRHKHAESSLSTGNCHLSSLF